MSPPSRLFPRAWIIAPICALLFLAWADYRRMLRVDFVSAVAEENAATDAASPTGYAGGKRWLIVPEHNNHSYQWIAETEQMFARGEWRVRQVDYENAPFGREVHSASPYRWWLGIVAWCDHAISGRPIGRSVERTALYAEPLLHLLLLVGSTILIARWFGVFPAALFAIGLVTLFPLAAAFLPGVPDCFSLVQACALWSVLPLLAGWAGQDLAWKSRPKAKAVVDVGATRRRSRRRFFLAGVVGGCGLWVSAVDQVPIVEGIALGALLAAGITRIGKKANAGDIDETPPWRVWALGGATACLAAYLIEYFPAHMDLRLRVNHPLFGLAWLGVGELLAWFATWMARGKPFSNWREASRVALGAIGVAALPAAMAWSGKQSFLAGDLLSTKLTNLPDGATAKSLGNWISRDGLTAMIAATCLPLLLAAPAAWLLARRATGAGRRTVLAIAFGPVLVAAGLAWFQLRWWNTLDGVALALFVTTAAGSTGGDRWWWSGLATLVFVPGLVQLWPAGAGGSTDFKFTRAEVEGLYERALAHWLADHAGPAGVVVLVPPYRTSSFCFYGGLRGLGTQNWENREGLLATFRIATATRPDETQALINERGVTHIVIPSWDTDLDDFARMGLKQPEGSFIYALNHWVLFNWLRALPYKLPEVGGFEGQSVKVFEVTDEADPATHRSRLVEYFVEMQQLDIAAQASMALRRYPADLGALVALAQVEKARDDQQAFTTDFNALVSNLASGSDRALPWDRRVSLAVVLALGRRNDLAREQVQRCLEQIDETRLRSLTTGSLYHLLVLCKAFGQGVADPRLRELSSQLLPAELRARL